MAKMVSLKSISPRSPAKAVKKTFRAPLLFALILCYIKDVIIRPVTRSTLRNAQNEGPQHNLKKLQGAKKTPFLPMCDTGQTRQGTRLNE